MISSVRSDPPTGWVAAGEGSPWGSETPHQGQKGVTPTSQEYQCQPGVRRSHVSREDCWAPGKQTEQTASFSGYSHNI